VNLLRLAPTLLRGLSSLNPLGRRPPPLRRRVARGQACARWRSPPKARRLDAGAEVHPSAVVEASWLGPGAKVGAGAIVRGCVLGAGAQVEEQGLVEGTVLAPGARVQRKAMVKFSLLREGAMAGGYMQLGVLDQNSAFKLTSALLDQSFGAPVEVRVRRAALHGTLRASPGLPRGPLGGRRRRDGCAWPHRPARPGRSCPTQTAWLRAHSHRPAGAAWSSSDGGLAPADAGGAP
jgi:hypothetical protein